MNGAWVYIGERVIPGEDYQFRGFSIGRFSELVPVPVWKIKPVYRYRWPEVANA